MATEEQTASNSQTGLYGAPGINRFGQKLTISSRIVSKLSFYMAKEGNPTGTLYFRIRKVSDDSLVASKGMDISTLQDYSLGFVWIELTFDTSVFVNEAVRICAEYTGGDAPNSGAIRFQTTDVKASEFYSQYVSSWDDSNTDRDCAYIYTYTLSLFIPTVTIIG